MTIRLEAISRIKSTSLGGRNDRSNPVFSIENRDCLTAFAMTLTFLKGLIATFCLLMVIVNSASGQQDSIRQKASYYNSFVAGTLIGCGECANGKDFTFSFLTLHGIKFPAGVKLALGAGMDVYSDWRLFPLIGSITIDRELRDNGVYVQFNSGYSWGRYTYPLTNENVTQQSGGFVVNPMIGYRVGKGKSIIYLQAGYKFQLAKVSYSPAWWWGPAPGFTREYDLSRVVLQMGFGFN